MASNRPATANRANNQMRGFGGGADTRGGRNGAFGGYQPGGRTEASSNRGRSSVGGGGLGGRGGGGGGGGEVVEAAVAAVVAEVGGDDASWRLGSRVLRTRKLLK